MVWIDTNESDRRMKKQLTVETVGPPLVPAERSNGVAAQRARTREVNSRYMSSGISSSSAAKRRPSHMSRSTTTPASVVVSKGAVSTERKQTSSPISPSRLSTPVQDIDVSLSATPSAAKRCPSPMSRSITTPASVVVPKRAVSAVRKQPSSPISPSRMSTPVQDIDVSLSTRKIALTKQPESLWPSIMRNLSFSFQFDGYANPTAKKENHVTHSLSDISFRRSSNASHKQPELCPSSKKATPERKRSPLKGKSLLDQTENATLAENSQSRLVDQHPWPSRMGGKISSISLNRNVDCTAKIIRSSYAPLPRIMIPSSRRLSDGMSKPIQKIPNGMTTQVSSDSNIIIRKEPEEDSSGDLTNLLKLPKLRKPPPLSSSDRTTLLTPVFRSQSLPSLRHPSPIRTASHSKVYSPSHSRPDTPRGLSPSRTRPLSSTSQSSSSSSVLSFIADFRKLKKSNQLEDAHQLQLLHNRYSQWRFANARTDVALRFQKITAERNLHNVWSSNLALRDSVIKKNIRLQQMRLQLKLSLILNEQLRFLDEWASLEKGHSFSLAWIIKDLEASTFRLPLTEGSRANIKSLKISVSSAMDVMQSMGPSVITLLSRAREVNNLVTRLADLAVQERAMLDGCQALLALNATMQVQESRLQTHLIQTYRAMTDTDYHTLLKPNNIHEPEHV